MNIRHQVRRSLLLGCVVVAVPLTAQATLSASGTPSVSFTASGPGGMKIIGTTSELSVRDAPDTLLVNVPLANLTTGIALRDSHMRDKYLQVATYPNATLAVPRAGLTLPAVGSSYEGDAAGTMTLHGQARPASVHYVVSHGAQAYSVTGTVRVNMKDYGIDVPTYLGVGVKPDVDVTVKFDAKDAP